MISRYLLPEFKILWSDYTRFLTMWDVELAAVKAMEDEGIIPKDTHENLLKFNLPHDIAEQVETIEKKSKHETLAFISFLESKIDKKYSKWIHFGLTSSDVLDSSQAILLGKAAHILIEKLLKLIVSIKTQAKTHESTKIMARTHGMFADVTTLGFILNGYLKDLERNVKRLQVAKETILVGKISGAVGNYNHIAPEIEFVALNALGLKCEEYATQVVSRDRYAEYFSTLAIVASSLERLATNIRLYHRTEVNELCEGFTEEQKGSSAMPHKQNPILSENICGLSRIVRSFVNPTLENVALWHERDMTHSSVERFSCIDATSTLGFMLDRMCHIMDNLVVNQESIKKNIDLSNKIFLSQNLLLSLIKKDFSREDAYKTVQELAFTSKKYNKDFSILILQSPKLLDVFTKQELIKVILGI